jgi:uncharacterized protein YjbJ (UPF0337 family)
MATSNQDRIKGSMDIIKGKAKKIVGEVTDDQKLQNDGSMDQVKGRLEKGKASVKDAIRRTLDKA